MQNLGALETKRFLQNQLPPVDHSLDLLQVLNTGMSTLTQSLIMGSTGISQNLTDQRTVDPYEIIAMQLRGTLSQKEAQHYLSNSLTTTSS